MVSDPGNEDRGCPTKEFNCGRMPKSRNDGTWSDIWALRHRTLRNTASLCGAELRLMEYWTATRCYPPGRSNTPRSGERGYGQRPKSDAQRLFQRLLRSQAVPVCPRLPLQPVTAAGAEHERASRDNDRVAHAGRTTGQFRDLDTQHRGNVLGGQPQQPRRFDRRHHGRNYFLCLAIYSCPMPSSILSSTQMTKDASSKTRNQEKGITPGFLTPSPMARSNAPTRRRAAPP